ncbi:MAG: hypothetical protein KA807_19870 [Prolixibacteraceae bacterium]|nr:hypothetical protein [Prolixibacteraceae bacterium]
MHEYCVIGHPREKIIFIMAFISITLAPIVSTIVQTSFQTYFHIVVALTLSSSSVFAFLYFLFNKYLWRISIFKKMYSFPDFNGRWECKGKSFNKELNIEFEWTGTVVITQTWDKILISLQTGNSSSRSISVISGIKYYPGLGYKLSYHYENIPMPTATDLKKHEGFCSLVFNENFELADGFYFNNNKERQTYGEMKLMKGA